MINTIDLNDEYEKKLLRHEHVMNSLRNLDQRSPRDPLVRLPKLFHPKPGDILAKYA